MERLVFMGTPDFAVPVLKALIGRYEIVGVVARPDQRVGRGHRVEPPPVKIVAMVHDLPVLQPPRLRQPEVVAELRALAPEVMVVAAYGQILPAEVLAIPPRGCLNVHASLLPRYRGAAPIAAAILAGEEETGVTIMLMDEGMDSGPILSQATCSISPQDTRESLTAKLAQLGADLLMDTLPRWLAGAIEPQPQDHRQATYSRIIAKQDGLIDWTQPAVEIWRRCRAYYSWPGSYTYWRGKVLKVLRAQALPHWSGGGEPGQVMALDEGLAVATGEGALLLDEVQLAGKRALDAEDFARGQRDFVGSVLGRGGYR
ncbi:MAG: methionyl-tRNA formyltransferase [Chloroflexi bacterium]|nr:methionyl-tRNA formyltransferase [Chloroflexota bacterium]